jgi:hypothetical protein
MKKILLTLPLVALLASCAGPKAGLVPSGKEKSPDITARYVEMGHLFMRSRVEKLDYPDFADAKCQAKGSKGYSAYDAGWISGFFFGGYPIGIPVTDIARNVKIWCK